jgi:antitoxin component YwqK of YwqJK toxin-antitoxin module
MKTLKTSRYLNLKSFLFFTLNVCFFHSFILAESQTKEGEKSIIKRESSFYILEGQEVYHGSYRESSNEKLLATGNYHHGHKEGLWESWHENGLPKHQQFWSSGNKDGMHRAWYSSGNLNTKVLFKQNSKDGFEEIFYENGERQSYSQWEQGIKNGPHQEWHSNGQEALRCMYVHGQLDGPLKKWNPKGELILEEIYQNGTVRKLLLSSEKYNNGNMKLAYSYYFDDLKQEIKHGRFNKWFPNGENWIQCDYVHGKIHGIWQYGKLDGLHCRQESYDMGVKHGIFKWYHQGELVKEEIWKMGKKVNIKNY